MLRKNMNFLFQKCFYNFFFILTLQLICSNTLAATNLTSFLPDSSKQSLSFPPSHPSPPCFPGYPIPPNYRFPRLPNPAVTLQPPYCYTDYDCAPAFVNASQAICKHRPGGALPSICDCHYNMKIILNGGGRPGLHSCEKWYCYDDNSRCQYSEWHAPWLLALFGPGGSNAYCHKARLTIAGVAVCGCKHKMHRRGCSAI